MPQTQLLLLAIWTLLLVRALSLRATISLRTLGTFLILGAVLGPVAFPVVQSFFNSYGSYQVYHWPFVAFGVELLLLAPVLVFLFYRRVHQVTSVGDAFLLAFMVGFGYDLITALTGDAGTSQLGSGISYFPPFAFRSQNLTVAGFGYWSGLIALAIAAAARFLRTRTAAYIAAAVAAFWVVAEISGLAGSQGAPSLLAAVFGNMTLHGLLTPWLCLLALLGLSLWEGRWISAPGGVGTKLGLASQWSAALTALAGGKLDDFRWLTRASRLCRQWEFAKAELSRTPSDPYLTRICRDLDKQLLRAESAPAAVKTSAPIGQVLIAWAKHRALQIALVVSLLVIVFLFPEIPALRDFFWRFSLLNAPLLPLNLSLLSCALIAVIAWRYLSAEIAPESSTAADDVLQFSGEDAILQVSLFAVFLALLYGKTEHLYSLKAAPQLLGLAPAPTYDHGQLTTTMLLIAAAAMGLSLKRNDALRGQSMGIRRAAAIARTINLFVLLSGLGVVLIFFQQGQILLHSIMRGRLFDLFGRNANSAGDTVVSIVTAAFSFAIFWGLFLLSDRAKNFLASSSLAPGAPGSGTQEGANVGAP
jgi:hypothetical protein